VVVVEDDPFPRLIQVILDPDTPAARVAAFSHFFAHELPDFTGWCKRLRTRLKRLHPADVRLVPDQAGLLAGLAGATAVVTESLAVGKQEIAAAGGTLRIVQKYGTVLSGIDTASCGRAGIRVLTLRRRANISCAEHAFGLMLALARKIPLSNSQVHAGGWQMKAVAPIHRLRGRVLGLVGFGRIPQLVAPKAKAFGLRVLAHDPFVPAAVFTAAGVEPAGFSELLGISDYVSIHTPLAPQTRGLFGADVFARMKPTAYLVNTARGPIVNEAALASALDAGRLAGAALDVFEHEPRVDPRLLALPNVVLTPHIGSAEVELRARMAAVVVDNILAVLAGRRPPNCANPEVYG